MSEHDEALASTRLDGETHCIDPNNLEDDAEPELAEVDEHAGMLAMSISCTWWDSLTKAALEHGQPVCPHCGRPALRFPEKLWWERIDYHGNSSAPGYRQFVEWLRGRCFPNERQARAVYGVQFVTIEREVSQ